MIDFVSAEYYKDHVGFFYLLFLRYKRIVKFFVLSKISFIR